jgi:hypothetical protein
MPVLAAQRRDRERAELPGIDRDRTAGERLDHIRRVYQTIEEPRRLAEHRHVLFEINADAAEEHLRLAADVGFVGKRRRIKRQ